MDEYNRLPRLCMTSELAVIITRKSNEVSCTTKYSKTIIWLRRFLIGCVSWISCGNNPCREVVACSFRLGGSQVWVLLQ